MRSFALLLLLPSFPAFALERAEEKPAEQLRHLQLTSLDILRLEFVPTVLVGDPGVIEVRPSAGTSLQVTPKKEGSSTLVLYDAEGHMQHRFLYQVSQEAASAPPPDPRVAGVAKLLRKVPGLTFSFQKGEVVIEGVIEDPAHAERIDAVVGTFPKVKDQTVRGR